jgi:hypothetical protein
MSALLDAARTTGRGDVCVKAGNYTTTSYVRLASGVRLHGSGVTITYTGAQASLGLFNADGTNNIVVDGFTLDGMNRIAAGVRSQNGAHHVVARNLTIRNMGESGVQFQKSDHVVAVGNKISHVGYAMGWGSAIGLWFGGKGSTSRYDSAAGFHAVIAKNEIFDVVDRSSYRTDGNGIIIDGGGALYPVLIAGNIIHDVRGRGVSSIWNSGELWIVNNTVARASNADKCDYASYSVQGFTGRVRWVNNISQPGCGPNYARYDTATGYSWTRGINSNTVNHGLTPPSAEVKVTNPMLDGTTFVPRTGSPAIGAAVDVRALLSSALLSTGGSYLPTHRNLGAR